MRRSALLVVICFLLAFSANAGKTVSIPESELTELAKHVDHLIKRDSINEAIIQKLKDSLNHTGAVIKQPETAVPEDTSAIAETPLPPSTSESPSIWLFVLLAFTAGLVSVVTPCVFPMVPMTVSFFTNSSGSRGQAIQKAILYGLSIIFIYTLIGVLLARLNGADFALFISSNWIPNAIFALIFIVFALSFFGLFEITLPHKFINNIDKQSDRGGYLGLFFMAFTIVLVSFSCTGPIVSTILVEAAGGEIIKPIAGMLAYSSAFALPFTLFALFPGMLKSLPKSGGWLNTVKVSLGFIELALALKFLIPVDQTLHVGILTRPVFLVLWILIFSALALYLAGGLRFSEHDKVHAGKFRVTLSVLTLAFVIYLAGGLGLSLKEISGYIPPPVDHSKGYDKLCGRPKYDTLLHLPHDLQGYFDYKEALACAKQQGKPLFIDFTGHSCSNCREMESNVWSDPRVLKMLKEDFVMVSLYYDEPYLLPESEWYTSEIDQKVKKTIGKQTTDFQHKKYNSNAYPLYCIIDPATEKDLTTPVEYNRDIEAYLNFLKLGKQNYKKLSK